MSKNLSCVGGCALSLGLDGAKRRRLRGADGQTAIHERPARRMLTQFEALGADTQKPCKPGAQLRGLAKLTLPDGDDAPAEAL